MKFPFLASCILFILVLTRAIRISRRKQGAEEESFWDREAKANSVRKKSLDSLDYIQIPFDRLPTGTRTEDPAVAESLRILRDLSTQKIVNLTGYTNTELKLEYGTANITVLSEYDQNYTVLARTLQTWADALWEAGCREEAAAVLEFALETRSDISRTYYRLAEYYSSRGDSARIRDLISAAENLRSSNKNIIVRTLKKSYP